MNKFDNLLRFFSVADNDSDTPDNLSLPQQAYPALPVVPGDALRFLIPVSDCGGVATERLRVGIRPAGTVGNGTLIGRVRRQAAEYYTEIRLRVGAPPLPDAWRQFALTLERDNPKARPVNVALNKTVTGSSPDTVLYPHGLLTDGTYALWSTDYNVYEQHEEAVTVDLAQVFTVGQVVLSPRNDFGYVGGFWPVDFVLEVSLDNVSFAPVLTVLNQSKPADSTNRAFSFAETRVRYLRLRATRLRAEPFEVGIYRLQFTELQVMGYVASEAKTTAVPVLGTFRGQQTDREGYIEAIRQHYERYPYAVVQSDRNVNELRIRAYHNQRFQLNGEALQVGMGTVREQNTNQPTLTALITAGVVIAAVDSYVIDVGSSIAAGNLYTLNGITYTATGREKPADVLSALGVVGGKLTVAAGSAVQINVQAGSQIVTNANRPTLQLLYTSTSGGNDLYTAVVGNDVVPGNTYQVSATGVMTRTKTAGPSDTKATIEAFFNNVSAHLVLPAGSLPSAVAYAGTTTVPNINLPRFRFFAKQTIAAHTVDRYQIWVGAQVEAGNSYSLKIGLDTRSVVAEPTDRVLDIVGRLGYSAHPFTVDVPTGTALQAYAEPGPRYNPADNLADVILLSTRTVRHIDRVVELTIPALTAGRYQLTLLDYEGGLLGVSNYLDLKPGWRYSAMVRFGGAGSVYGFDYAEDGLVQQLRLPLYVDAARPGQEENLYKTLDNENVRGLTRAYPVRSLTTNLQREAFHRCLWMVLKHPMLEINGLSLHCEGEYSTSAPQGQRRRMQGTALLTETEGWSYDANKLQESDSPSGLYSLIAEVEGLGGLWINVRRLNFVETVTEGLLLPAAEYELHIRTGADALRLTIGQNGRRVTTVLLSPNRLNRTDLIRFEAGRISLRAEVIGDAAGGWQNDPYWLEDADVVDTIPEQQPTDGDFSTDYGSDYGTL